GDVKDTKGENSGTLALDVTADLGAGHGKLPAVIDLQLQKVEVSGAIGKQAPKLFPVLDGARTGDTKLPPVTVSFRGKLDNMFDAKEAFQKDPTLDTIDASGDVSLGPGKLDNSSILKSFSDGLDKIGMKDQVDKAAGGDASSFDSGQESFTI